MNRLCDEILASEVPEGSVRMWWLAQAGFAFKTPGGKIVYADPYFYCIPISVDGFSKVPSVYVISSGTHKPVRCAANGE